MVPLKVRSRKALVSDRVDVRLRRGAAWMHTAVRENFMAAQLSASMGPAGILGANGAMGIYRYGAPNQPFGPAVSVPACIVETTRGNCRDKSDCRFRKTATEYDTKPGIKWLSLTAK